MNQISSLYADRSHDRRFLTPIVYLVISLLILTACLGGLGGDAEVPAENAEAAPIVEGNQGSLTCTDKCRNRGQCGDRVDGQGTAVLMGAAEPKLTSHERSLPAGTVVQIQRKEPRSMQSIANGEVIDQTFYLVTSLDNTVAGYVVEWCVQLGGQ